MRAAQKDFCFWRDDKSSVSETGSKLGESGASDTNS